MGDKQESDLKLRISWQEMKKTCCSTKLQNEIPHME